MRKLLSLAALVAVLFAAGCKKSSTPDVVLPSAPTIVSFTPTTGSVGTTVTITGTNLTGATSVTFGGVAAASFTVVSATSITAVVGAGAAGAVAVTTPGGIASLAGFNLIAAPGTKFDVRGVITASTTWKKDYIYRLRGYVYVENGATLTIEPGTKIVSNKDSAGVLVIVRGAKIIADGTVANPIVFTSAEATPVSGDFGGVIVAGAAPGNNNHIKIEGGVDSKYELFGGTNATDNSGIIRYVRIEYAGKAVNPGDEVNGLSLYGVGSGTIVDYVEVLRGYDDAFEIFGGTVNCKHLIAYNSADDDFDFDDGYVGKIQYAISIKDPAFTDPKGTTGDVSNNFEVDNVNPANGFLLNRTPITAPTMSNFTAIGPNNAAGVSVDYGWGMRWRRGAKFVLANSVVIGSQNGCFRLQEDSTIAYHQRGISAFYNSYMHTATKKVIDVQTGLTIPGLTYDSTSVATQLQNTYFSKIVADPATLMLGAPFNNAAPNLKPLTGSPLLTGSKFDFGNLNDAFFDKVTFVGALDASNDWTAGWAIFNK